METQMVLVPKNARHFEVLMDFICFCHNNPDLRFWQALRAWSGQNFIFASETGPHDLNTFSISDLKDTFWWGEKNDERFSKTELD
jgi:hypothetical protein